MTTDWKRAVDARLTALGKTRLWLAQQVGTSKSAITGMLGDKQHASVYVDDVCRVLELPPPAIGLPSDVIKEAVELLSGISEEDQLNVLATLRMIRRGYQKG